MAKYFCTRFSLTIEGRLEKVEGRETVPFRIAAGARGADVPGQGHELTGVVTVRNLASDRPLLGTLSGEKGKQVIEFRFADDELDEHWFQGTLRGPLGFGRPELSEGFLSRRGGDAPWARLRSAAVSVTSRRIGRRPRRPRFTDRMGSFLRRRNRPLPRRRTAVLFAEAAFPAGKKLPGGGEDTVARVAAGVLMKSKAARFLLGAGLVGVEGLFFLTTGERFSRAPREERANWLMRSLPLSGRPRRFLYRRGFTALTPVLIPLVNVFKYFHINTDDAHQRLGSTRLFGVAPDLAGLNSGRPALAPEPTPPWEAQVLPAAGFDSDEVVSADAVVIGTGAGGGPVAKELAERGFATAIIEAGKFFRRQDSPGGSQNATISLGNVPILLPMGQAVGGTTFINAGTCFRTPPDVLLKWAREGRPELHPDRMGPYFDRVEEIIQVAEADPKYVGPVGEVIRRGCERLGYHSMNLRRNAPLCEGQALCSVGCPHGAKQSTDRSYIPLALKSKASLFSGFRVREILTGRGRAIGVQAYGKGRDGKTVRLTVFARAVVLAAGALLTPPLLQRNRLDRGNPWIGANLSIHPGNGVAAIVPGVEVRAHQCIPQGYGVDEFREQGLMFEGANIPPTVWALMMQGLGPRYVELLEQFPNMACFGYMVKDTSRGRVRPGIAGRPLVFYSLNRADLRNLVKGMAILSRIFLAAGAQRVFGATVGVYEMSSERDVARFESRNWRPRDFFLSAYHCLGTARIGPDPKVSALTMDHECHRVPGLFVVDGSAVPGSVGVNPQVTIMAMATRAAERIARILDQ